MISSSELRSTFPNISPTTIRKRFAKLGTYVREGCASSLFATPTGSWL